MRIANTFTFISFKICTFSTETFGRTKQQKPKKKTLRRKSLFKRNLLAFLLLLLLLRVECTLYIFIRIHAGDMHENTKHQNIVYTILHLYESLARSASVNIHAATTMWYSTTEHKFFVYFCGKRSTKNASTYMCCVNHSVNALDTI